MPFRTILRALHLEISPRMRSRTQWSALHASPHPLTISPYIWRWRSGWTTIHGCSIPSLHMNSDMVFIGQFSEIIKSTTDTQDVAFQPQCRSQGLMWLHSWDIKSQRSHRDVNARHRASQKLPHPPIMAPAAFILLQVHRRSAMMEVLVAPCCGVAAWAREGRIRNEVPNAVGGRLQAYGLEWEGLTSGKWMLQTILMGYRVEFAGPACLTWSPM